MVRIPLVPPIEPDELVLILAGQVPAIPAGQQRRQPAMRFPAQRAEVQIHLRLEPIDDIADVERIGALGTAGMIGMGDEDQFGPLRAVQWQEPRIDRLLRADQMIAAKERRALDLVGIDDSSRSPPCRPPDRARPGCETIGHRRARENASPYRHAFRSPNPLPFPRRSTGRLARCDPFADASRPPRPRAISLRSARSATAALHAARRTSASRSAPAGSTTDRATRPVARRGANCRDRWDCPRTSADSDRPRSSLSIRRAFPAA